MKKYDFMKIEDYGWGYKEFSLIKSRDIKDELQVSPLLSRDEITKCFVEIKKVEDFMKRFEIKDYLFISLAGTGKTSLLSYLSMKAEEKDYKVYWILISKVVPDFEVFIERLNLRKKSKEKCIFVFDNIHNNLEIIDLVYKINQRFPQIKIWMSTRYYDMFFLEKEWEKIQDKFTKEYLPGLLERKDIRKFLAKFENFLSQEEREELLKKEKISLIHLTLIYQKLKCASPGEDKTEIIKKTPLKAQEVYHSIYRSLTDCEKSILKLIAYQDGISENNLLKAVKILGVDQRTIYELIDKQIIYKDSFYKFLPNLQDIVVFSIIDELKEIVLSSVHTLPYEKESVIPNVLIKVDTTEEIIALSSKYALFSQDQKKEYLKLLKKHKEKLPIFWLISNLATEGEDKLLKYLNYEIKVGESKTDREIYARALGNFGYTYFIKKDYKSSIECFKKAINIYPNSSRLWFNLGVVYGINCQLDEEIKCYYDSVKINNQNESAWYNLGLAYDKKGDYDQEIKCLREAIRINPKNDKTWYNLALCYGKKGWVDEEVKYYKETLSINPKDACVWYNLGIVYTEKERYNQAVLCFQEALSINSKDAHIWYNLGITYGRLNKVNEEINCFRKVVELKPSLAKAWYNLGVAFEEIGNVDQEREAYENVVNIKPDWIEAWHNLAMSYWKIGQIEEELKCYQRIKELNPSFKVL
ncbi:tetratricopeptide repeat protein [bacterium]|nr:tetratricopeptide repeat protein [bacterium]